MYLRGPQADRGFVKQVGYKVSRKGRKARQPPICLPRSDFSKTGCWIFSHSFP